MAWPYSVGVCPYAPSPTYPSNRNYVTSARFRRASKLEGRVQHRHVRYFPPAEIKLYFALDANRPTGCFLALVSLSQYSVSLPLSLCLPCLRFGFHLRNRYDPHGFQLGDGVDVRGSMICMPNSFVLWRPKRPSEITIESLRILELVIPKIGKLAPV